jgi:calcineurin-like phosphoesterase family protein
MLYTISDLHFGHGNIIDYCDRPFHDTEQMNASMREDWNRTVGEDDTVLFLGDVRHHPSEKSAAEWLSELSGDVLAVRGNHDSGLTQNSPHHVVESCTIRHGKYTFYCEHKPVQSPGWQIHGHIHNNDIRNHPFIDPQAQRVNVSAELLGYEPLLMDELVYLLGKHERFNTLQEARRRHDIYDQTTYQ